MNKNKTAMISSTSIDLPEHRKQAMDACLRQSLLPIAMEHLPARDSGAVQVSLEMVDRSDIYIGIYAWRYGWIPEGSEISVTEMEFDRAVERGIPILVFLMHEDHPITAKDMEADADAQAKLKAFKVRASKDRIRAEFKSAIELRGLVVQALADLERREQTESGAKPAPQFHRLSHIPPAPEPYIAHPYTLLHSKDLVGRQGELNLLTDWVTANHEVPASVRVFNVVAIGGMGKSALTWKWFKDIAPLEMPNLAGRLWWSFYESDAHYENFSIRALAYMTEIPEEEARKLPYQECEDRLFRCLDERPFLLVLDGLERILLAYARMDAAHLADDDLDERTANRIAEAHGLPDSVKETYLEKHRLRRCADPRAGRLLRRLAQVRASRVLVSTRLYPAELQTNTAQPVPGCHALFLDGLADDDALNLWREFHVSGAREDLLPLFQAFGNYPLLLRALAGEVAEYRPAPGDFGRWRSDHPDFNPAAELDLRNAKTHVLQFALQGLGEAQRRVLHTLAAFRMPAGWETLRDLLVGALNPLLEGGAKRGRRSRRVRGLGKDFPRSGSSESMENKKPPLNPPHPEPFPIGEVEKDLDCVLTELEDRGLVGWDREANRYDLHPIVRGVIWAMLSNTSRKKIHKDFTKYFDAALKPTQWRDITDLEQLTPAIELYHSLVFLEKYEEAWDIFYNHLEVPTHDRFSLSRLRIELLSPLIQCSRNAISNLESPSSLLGALTSIGTAHFYAGELGQAVCYLRSGVSLSEQSPLLSGPDPSCLCNLANCLRVAGIYFDAMAFNLEAIRSWRNRNYPLQEGRSTVRLGLAFAATNQIKEAYISFCRSLRIAKILRHEQFEGYISSCIAQSNLWESRNSQASRYAEIAWAMADKFCLERDFVRASRLQGQVAVFLENQKIAEERLHHALHRARAVNYVEEELPALTALAELHRRGGEYATARELLEQVWDAAERGPYPLLHADARNVLAQIERDQGDAAAAIAAATQAYRLAWCDGPPYAYHYGLTNARRHLQELGAPEPELPPFDESKFEPMPEVELNPRDEFYVDPDQEPLP